MVGTAPGRGLLPGGRSSSFDNSMISPNSNFGSSDNATAGCVAFPRFAAQPPAQARYVRGIRVEANAPSDVDYSNVNNALRQLHMERRVVAEAKETDVFHGKGQRAAVTTAAAAKGRSGQGVIFSDEHIYDDPM